MRITIFTILLISSITTFSRAQTIKDYSQKKINTHINNSNDTSYSAISVYAYFNYIFIENKTANFTNAKGFGADLQINQNNYTSWMIGFNINFYKSFKTLETYNLSTLNLLMGPKFYFSTSRTSMFARINAGVTFFSDYSPGARKFSVSLFPALGLEHDINKIFRFSIESRANTYIDLMGIQGHFSVNIGLISSF